MSSRRELRRVGELPAAYADEDLQAHLVDRSSGPGHGSALVGQLPRERQRPGDTKKR